MTSPKKQRHSGPAFTPCEKDAGLLDELLVLLLEDEFLIAMDVEQLCRDHGAADVLIATTLEDARALLASRTFDAAIVDLMLDGRSTLDFARTLQQGGIPFIFASGYSDTQELEQSFPGVALVSKPYGGTELVEALAAARR
jgi:CheY-like chemotaxis protein